MTRVIDIPHSDIKVQGHGRVTSFRVQTLNPAPGPQAQPIRTRRAFVKDLRKQVEIGSK